MVTVALPSIECILIKLPPGACDARIAANGYFSYSLAGRGDETFPLGAYCNYYPLGMLNALSKTQYKNILQYTREKGTRLFRNYLDGSFAFEDPAASFQTLLQHDSGMAAEITSDPAHWFLCKKESSAAALAKSG